MIKIVAENYIKEEHQKEFLKLTKELIILSREEAGNISYHLHNQTKHFTTIVPQIKSFTSKPSRAVKYKEVQ